MLRPKPTVRVRLTALYAAVLVASTAVLLTASYVLLERQLHRTLPERLADDTLDRLAVQYLLGLVGVTLLGVALGWALAGRVLAPLQRITATARRVSDERLDERIGLAGPQDELRELGDTVDAMLDRLQDAFGTQKRFVANASHELRSPLTVIRTEAEVALAGPDADREELRAALQHVLEAADRTESLLEALLLLARTQGAIVLREPYDLARAARTALASVQDAADKLDVLLRSDARPAPVLGDGPLLDRLAANLVDNALRYNHPGGTVDVSSAIDRGWSVLRVSNTGPVVASEDARRLIEPFERLGRRADAGGTGLGLSIVASVVQAHGGRLTIEPRAKGGLDVEVALPATSSARSHASHAAPAAGSPAS